MSTPELRTFDNPMTSLYERPGGPWFGQDLGRLLTEMEAREDLICGVDIRLSAGEVRSAALHAAGWLRRRGVVRGSAVAWQLTNAPDVVVLYLATWWLGAVAVPFHESLTPVEARRVLDRLGETPVIVTRAGAPLSSLDGITIAPTDLIAEFMTEREVLSPSCTPQDAAVILTTSGSNGTPKSVVHSQRSLAYKARQLTTLHGTSAADAVLVPAPLAHMAGLLHGVMHPLATGVKAVIMTRWDPNEALRLVRDEAISMLFGPPIYALGIAGAPGFSSAAVRSVRLVSSGGTPITEAYVKQVTATFGAVVKRTYGSTEAPIVCTTLTTDDPRLCSTTDGRAAPGAQLEVRDTDGVTILESGMPGEIWLRGPELCDGYLDPAQTKDAFIDGWMRTRDIGTLDADGFLTVGGRISGMIIRGGMNISAREVETALESHPDISQAVVIGYPDDVYGERVAAFIVSRTSIDRALCVEWFAEYGVAKYKVPDRIERLDEMPVLATFQKPDLARLRSLLE